MSVVHRNPALIEHARQARLDRLRQQYIARLNTCIASVRLRFITALPGQDMVYSAKEEEARRYLLEQPEGLEDYPFIAAELGTLAETPHQVAQIWLNMSAHWRQVAAQLENLRMAANQALAQAQSHDEMELILDQCRNQMEV